jgi:hypothetical protein
MRPLKEGIEDRPLAPGTCLDVSVSSKMYLVAHLRPVPAYADAMFNCGRHSRSVLKLAKKAACPLDSPLRTVLCTVQGRLLMIWS